MELCAKDLPDGRRVSVIQLTYGRGRVCVSPPGEPLFYSDGY